MSARSGLDDEDRLVSWKRRDEQTNLEPAWNLSLVGD